MNTTKDYKFIKKNLRQKNKYFAIFATLIMIMVVFSTINGQNIPLNRNKYDMYEASMSENSAYTLASYFSYIVNETDNKKTNSFEKYFEYIAEFIDYNVDIPSEYDGKTNLEVFNDWDTWLDGLKNEILNTNSNLISTFIPPICVTQKVMEVISSIYPTSIDENEDIYLLAYMPLQEFNDDEAYVHTCIGFNSYQYNQIPESNKIINTTTYHSQILSLIILNSFRILNIECDINYVYGSEIESDDIDYYPRIYTETSEGIKVNEYTFDPGIIKINTGKFSNELVKLSQMQIDILSEIALNLFEKLSPLGPWGSNLVKPEGILTVAITHGWLDKGFNAGWAKGAGAFYKWSVVGSGILTIIISLWGIYESTDGFNPNTENWDWVGLGIAGLSFIGGIALVILGWAGITAPIPHISAALFTLALIGILYSILELWISLEDVKYAILEKFSIISTELIKNHDFLVKRGKNYYEQHQSLQSVKQFLLDLSSYSDDSKLSNILFFASNSFSSLSENMFEKYSSDFENAAKCSSVLENILNPTDGITVNSLYGLKSVSFESEYWGNEVNYNTHRLESYTHSGTTEYGVPYRKFDYDDIHPFQFQLSDNWPDSYEIGYLSSSEYVEWTYLWPYQNTPWFDGTHFTILHNFTNKGTDIGGWDNLYDENSNIDLVEWRHDDIIWTYYEDDNNVDDLEENNIIGLMEFYDYRLYADSWPPIWDPQLKNKINLWVDTVGNYVEHYNKSVNHPLYNDSKCSKEIRVIGAPGQSVDIEIPIALSNLDNYKTHLFKKYYVTTDDLNNKDNVIIDKSNYNAQYDSETNVYYLDHTEDFQNDTIKLDIPSNLNYDEEDFCFIGQLKLTFAWESELDWVNYYPNYHYIPVNLIIDNQPPENEDPEFPEDGYYDGSTQTQYITSSMPVVLKANDEYGDCEIHYRYSQVSFDDEWTIVQGNIATFYLPGEGEYIVEWKSIDAAGNPTVIESFTVIVDDSAPETEIDFGDPYYTDGTDEWISTSTDITLTTDDSSGAAYINYTYGNGWNKVESDSVTFSIPDECQHTIQWYAVDHLGHEEETKSKTVIVDNTPPTTTSSLGMPYWNDGQTEWITPWTPITLSATDYPDCGPSGIKELHYDFSGDSQSERVIDVQSEIGHTEEYEIEFTLLDLIDLSSDEYWGPQTLTYYAVDNLGHVENTQTRNLKVVIPLHLDEEHWFHDGAHQNRAGYSISNADEPIPKEGHTCLKWTATVDKSDPYSGLLYPSGFVDIYYDNQGMDWTQVDSIDTLVYTSSDQMVRDCNKPAKTRIIEYIHNPMDAWYHDLSTDSTQVGVYENDEITLDQWNTYYWDFSSFQRDSIKSFRLHMRQNDDDYSSDGETVTSYVRGILVAGPMYLEDGSQHPLHDLWSVDKDYTVTDTDGDWCFEHNIQHAVNWEKEGKTITVEPGTYDENVYLFRDSVTVQKASENPLVDGTFLGPTFTFAANYLTLDGFDIIHGITGIYSPDTEDHNIWNCNIYDNNDDGIYLDNSADHHIQYTNVYHNTDDGLDAPSVDNMIIDNSTFHDNTDDGIYMDNSQNHDLTYCDVYLNGHDGYHADTVSNTDIISCDFYENSNDGIYLTDSETHNIKSCTIYENDDDGLDAPNVDDITMTDCVVYSNLDEGVYLDNSENHIFNSDYIHTNHDDGIYANTVDNIEIMDSNSRTNFGNGVTLIHSSNNLIQDSSFGGNHHGIYGDDVSDTTIINNLIPANGYTDDGAGIMFISDSDGFFNNIIDNNDISVNKNQGIFLGWYQGTGSPVISTNNEITNNIIHNDNHIGVHLANADNNLIQYNEIYGHENSGETGSGVYLFASYDNQVLDNRIYDNDIQVKLSSQDSQRIPGANTINYNFFSDDYNLPCENNVGVANYDSNTMAIVDARFNWWKFPDGPKSPDTGTNYDIVSGRPADGYGSSVIGPVQFDSWAGLDAYATENYVSVLAGDSVLFDAEDSFGGQMDETLYDVSYLWDFDDGSQSTVPRTGHVFNSPGTYDVSLRVNGVDNYLWPNFMYDWHNITVIVSEPGTPLAANADAESFGGYESIRNTDIQFHGIGIGGEPPYTYQWNFDDNSGTVNGREPIHQFSEAGTYNVRLTVVDSAGGTASDTVILIVNKPEPLTVDISESYGGSVGDKIWFTGTITGGIAPYKCSWDFGDGTTGTSMNPVHSYDQIGTYTVTVSVVDDEGSMFSSSFEVVISEGDEEEQDIEEVEIKDVSSKFARFQAIIETGDQPARCSITIDGGLILFGGETCVDLPAHVTESVQTPFTFGLGNVDIMVTANDISKEYSAFLVGPFFLHLEES